MYLGIASIVTRRKTSKCRRGSCGGDIEEGELAITVVRKGSKGRSYRWFHMECFVPWAKYLYERRKQYHAKHPPKRSGRPMGSLVKDLLESNPELALERHKCIRDSARLRRYLLATDDEDRQGKLLERISKLDERVKVILPRQIVHPGRRSRNDAERLMEIQRERGPSPREEAMRLKAARRKQREEANVQR